MHWHCQARDTLVGCSAVLATLIGATFVTSAAAVASAANCNWVMDTDYFPNQLGNVGVNLTRQQCCDICHNHSKCSFAVFGAAAEKIPRSCWLEARLDVLWHCRSAEQDFRRYQLTSGQHTVFSSPYYYIYHYNRAAVRLHVAHIITA